MINAESQIDLCFRRNVADRPGGCVDLDHVRAFLTLNEELHFGRTAERLYLSQSRVSRLISSLEAEIGAPLFERTSRRVRPEPLASELERQLRPAYEAMTHAVADAIATASAAKGKLRIGTPQTVDSPLLFEIINAHLKAYPACAVSVIETDLWDPYTPLRERKIDLLYNWLALDEPDLTATAIEQRERVLAVSRRHPLTSRKAVSLEDLAGFCVNRHAAEFPKALSEALVPPVTPSGRPIPRTGSPVRSPTEILGMVLSGQVVVPTVPTAPRYRSHPDIVLIPIRDMPPLPLGLIRCSSTGGPRISSFLNTASAMTRLPSRR